MERPFSDVAIQLHPEDNIAIAKREIQPGIQLELPGDEFVLIRDVVPAGHKFALVSIDTGASVIRYGHSVGIAIRPIVPGEWAHTHNLSVGRIQKEYGYLVVEPVPLQPPGIRLWATAARTVGSGPATMSPSLPRSIARRTS